MKSLKLLWSLSFRDAFDYLTGNLPLQQWEKDLVLQCPYKHKFRFWRKF